LNFQILLREKPRPHADIERKIAEIFRRKRHAKQFGMSLTEGRDENRRED
jgi:hypothetical protein